METKREGMERKIEGEPQNEDHVTHHHWFDTTPLPDRRINSANIFPEYHPPINPNPHSSSENHMYWDPMLPNLVQNPPILQNPRYYQNTYPNFNHLFPLGNSTTNNLINTDGFSTLGFNNNNGLSNLEFSRHDEFSAFGFGTSGEGFHDFAADHPLPHEYDKLTAYLNRLSISNNSGSSPTSNQRLPRNFIPNSTIAEAEWVMGTGLNQYGFLMAENYIKHLNLNTAKNGILNSPNWNQNSNGSSRRHNPSTYEDPFGYGFSKIRSSSSSHRNVVNKGSRSANRDRSRQHFGKEERGLSLNLLSTKDQRLENRFARQHIPSYYSLPLEELRGQIAFLAKDYVGCRFLQKKIEEGKMEDIEMIFNEVIKEGRDHLRELMVDQFGTELIQKLAEGTNRERRTKMLELIMSDERKLKDMCTDQHGSRAMQKLLKRVDTQEQQSSFMRILKRITIPLSKTQPGYFVIQVCLKNFSSDCTKGVLELVLDNFLALAKDRYGCCLVQNIVDHAHIEVKERLVSEIAEHARMLSEDPYGNYVVQHIIGQKSSRVTAAVLGQLQGYFVNLSMNKHGSNVVEKSLRETGEEKANMIINELMNSPDFLNVLQNPYGNYVAQSALVVSKGSVHNALLNIIRSNYSHLHSHLYGKRVLDKTRGGRNHA